MQIKNKIVKKRKPLASLENTLEGSYSLSMRILLLEGEKAASLLMYLTSIHWVCAPAEALLGVQDAKMNKA